MSRVKSAKNAVGLASVLALLLAAGGLYLARDCRRAAPAAAPVSTGAVTADPAGATLSRVRGPGNSAVVATAPKMYPASIPATASCLQETQFELDKLGPFAGLTDQEIDAVARIVTERMAEYQGIQLGLARVSHPERNKTIIAIPAFPEAGNMLEQALKSDVSAAIGDQGRAARLAASLDGFLMHQFHGFGQYPREISIERSADIGGAPGYSLVDRWTGGMSLSAGRQPVDISMTAADESGFAESDLMGYEFIRRYLPRPSELPRPVANPADPATSSARP